MACIAIIGNIEKFAVILFIPYFLEGFLKARGRFQKESFGKLQKDGTLRNRYPKWYGCEHIAISALKEKATEQRVVALLLCVQALFAVLAVLQL